jgi:hypothetical protein
VKGTGLNVGLKVGVDIARALDVKGGGFGDSLDGLPPGKTARQKPEI